MVTKGQYCIAWGQLVAHVHPLLQVKIQKLEQLVRLKDSKIATLQAKLQQMEPQR